MTINHSTYRKWVSTIISSLLLIGCSSNPIKPTPKQIAKDAGFELIKPVKRIRNYRIDGWTYINNRAIILDVGVDEIYLVTLLIPCRDLMTSEVITTTAEVGDLTKYDSIIAGFSTGARVHCPIDQLYSVRKKSVGN